LNSGIRIVYFGDSITYGQYLDPELRWTSIVDARLRGRFPTTTFETFNRGVSGETTAMGLARFAPDLQDLEPILVTIHFGLNDCNCWLTDRGLPRVSEDAYRANLLEMIQRARHFGARRIIVMTNHRTLRRDPMISGDIYEDASSRYSAIMREVAAGSGVNLCDIRSGFEAFDDESLDRLLLPAPDRLHLSAAGNDAYANLIWPHVEAAVADLTRGVKS
jgi:lysophospholipase L1-like esterase